ncbi:MAG: sodium:solute symporter [Puniceicoccaceae bacterium]
MDSLAPVDWLIIAVFIGGILLAGLAMSRKAAGGMDQYFLGGRRLPWYLLGVSGMAKWFDVSGTMIITSFLFMLGPQGLFVEFRGGAVLVLAFLLVFAGKWNRRSGCMTEAEWQVFRYGKGRDAEVARFLTAIVSIIAIVGALAYLVKGSILFIGFFFPVSPTLAALVLIGVATIYTMFSGFYGVVVTDFIQGAVIVVAAVFISILAWIAVGEMEGFGATAAAVSGNPGWLDALPAWKVDLPPAYSAYEGLVMVMLFYLIRNTLSGVGGGSEPRFFGARSDRECGLQCLLQGMVVMFRWPMMIGIAVLGILLVDREIPDRSSATMVAVTLKEAYPEVTRTGWMELVASVANQPDAVDPELQEHFRMMLGDRWDEVIRLVGFDGTVNPELILPAVLKTEIPAGLRGLLLAAMLAALMSTFDSALNVASGLFVRDIYKRWLRPKASDRECVRTSYLVVPCIVVLGIWLAFSARSINDIWGWLVMGLGTGAAAPAILRFVWWRMNGWGVAASLAFGTSSAILQRAYYPGLNEWFQFGLMATISFSAAIIVSLLTKPTDRETIIRFFRRTRPFGFWGPIRREIDNSERESIFRENRTDVLALPFVLTTQITLFLMPMLIVVHSYATFFLVLPFFCIGLLGSWWFWWRPLRSLGGSQ